MAIRTQKMILSTALSITFMQCCKIVLMFYNGSGLSPVDAQHTRKGLGLCIYRIYLVLMCSCRRVVRKLVKCNNIAMRSSSRAVDGN